MRQKLNTSHLEHVMLQAGLNRAGLARKMGVSRESVSRWFRTGYPPKPALLKKLAETLGLPIEKTVVGTRWDGESIGGARLLTGAGIQESVGSSVLLYEDSEHAVRVHVTLKSETLWLNLNQVAELFGRDKSVISRHLQNIYREGELQRQATVAYFATAQDEGGRPVRRSVEFHNLDAIISVGYRVNSKRGTLFRIWATGVLRDHLVKGYTVNQQRLSELSQAIRLIADVAGRRSMEGDEATALLRLAADYSFALDLLDDYDHQRVTTVGTARTGVQGLEHAEALRLVDRLRERYGASDLFGRAKDDSLQGALGAVLQTFGGQDVYPSLEEKAANLLYFLVKNHPFVDGNKRIGAALFLWFMEKNGALYRTDGTKRLADTALVAITLLIAESRPSEKDLLCRVLTHLLVRGE